MIPLDRALRIVDETLAGARTGGETIPVRSARGRVLRSDQISRLDLPPFDKSAMDGYAVAAGDVRDEYRLLETVAAGEIGSATLAPGTAVKVMTGATVPAGTGQVIKVELAGERDGIVRVRGRDSASNICRKAEDVRRGQTILTAGTTLGPLELANLIACGVREVEVAPRLRIAIVSTGGELVDAPELVTPGKIMNTNGPMLTVLSEAFGLMVTRATRIPDDEAATVDAIRTALAEADLVALSGGVSAGDFDYVGQALAAAELTVHFSRVAVKPGAPTTYASGGGKAVFGLPGNPVAAYLMFHLFVLRAVERISGARRYLREYTLQLGRRFERRKTERLEYVPCRLERTGVVAPVEYHGTAHLAALLQADGCFIVPQGTANIGSGDAVTFVPMTRAQCS